MSLQCVFDVGSGATLKDKETIDRIVTAVADADLEHSVVLKAQLFEDIPPNIPLRHELFDYLYNRALDFSLYCTASVFDKKSLEFLMGYKIPFIKIACRPDLRWLIDEIPRGIPVYASFDCRVPGDLADLELSCVDKKLACVPEYPASIVSYVHQHRYESFSDHTRGLELYDDLIWDHTDTVVWEKHLVEKRGDPENPDSGEFALQLDELMLLRK